MHVFPLRLSFSQREKSILDRKLKIRRCRGVLASQIDGQELSKVFHGK